MKFRVKIKDHKKANIIEAKSELDAKFKFCESKNLMLRIYLGKLEAKPLKQQHKAMLKPS